MLPIRCPLPPTPIARFHDSLARAAAASTFDATAAALATADASGRPSVRIVLVKTVDTRGFAFFTNRDSRKGRELAENPRAALCFHWPAIGEQVRAEGEVSVVERLRVRRVLRDTAAGEPIGAWASRQSAPLASRAVLEEAARQSRRASRTRTCRGRRSGAAISCARTASSSGERVGRLHHRTLFERAGDGWKMSLLNP